MISRIIILILTMLIAPTIAEAPINKNIPLPKNIVQHRAKQRPIKMLFEVTAYTKSDFSMNGKGITASGTKVMQNRTIASSRRIPYGTRIFFPKLGRTYVVEDRGGAIKGNRIDIYMDSRTEALKFGRKKLEGVILD